MNCLLLVFAICRPVFSVFGSSSVNSNIITVSFSLSSKRRANRDISNNIDRFILNLRIIAFFLFFSEAPLPVLFLRLCLLS